MRFVLAFIYDAPALVSELPLSVETCMSKDIGGLGEATLRKSIGLDRHVSSAHSIARCYPLIGV